MAVVQFILNQTLQRPWTCGGYVHPKTGDDVRFKPVYKRVNGESELLSHDSQKKCEFLPFHSKPVNTETEADLYQYLMDCPWTKGGNYWKEGEDWTIECMNPEKEAVVKLNLGKLRAEAFAALESKLDKDASGAVRNVKQIVNLSKGAGAKGVIDSVEVALSYLYELAQANPQKLVDALGESTNTEAEGAVSQAEALGIYRSDNGIWYQEVGGQSIKVGNNRYEVVRRLASDGSLLNALEKVISDTQKSKSKK